MRRASTPVPGVAPALCRAATPQGAGRRAAAPGSVPGQRHARGITLVELLIALVIIGILGAVALPLYDAYTARGFRTQAFTALADCALAMERFYTVNYTYVGAADDGGGNPTANGAPLATTCDATSPPDGNARYNITIGGADADSFTLTATAVNAQADDGNLQLDSTGARRWDKNDDGDYTDAGEDNWNE